MAERRREGSRLSLHYGNDTRLDRADLLRVCTVTYRYAGNALMPSAVLYNGMPALEYEWEDLLRLRHCVDHQRGIAYEFFYGEGRAPVSVLLRGRVPVMRLATGLEVPELRLRISVDQVDSVRALSTEDGRIIQWVDYDSFGNVTFNSRAGLFFPLGFACGLNDRYTGLVRFGFRDYDPETGRFTAKGPIGDTGGDHDLWDYCVDDPVSSFDPSGLLGMVAASIARQLATAGKRRKEELGWSPESTQELDFWDTVLITAANVGPSAVSFGRDLANVVLHPIDTAKGLGKTVVGYGAQVLGKEHEYRSYSDAVTRHLGNRYATVDRLGRTFVSDSVGVLGDAGTVLTLGGGAMRGAAG